MSRFFQQFIKNQNHGRQNRNTSDHTEYHAFCHNDSKIFTQGKTHETQCNKSGNRRDGTSTTEVTVCEIACAIAFL